MTTLDPARGLHAAHTTSADVKSQPVLKLSLFALTAMVVGSMVGSGIFSLPRTFGIATGPFGAIIAWCVAAGGMYCLARVFQALAERKPDLDAGVYAYAKAGFGDYPGFLSALGYWIGSCIGNVSYWVLIKSTLGAFFPVFGDGNTVTAIVVASIGIWLFHFMILRGVQQAAVINTIVTVAKIVPILTFIAILIFAFKADLFRANFWGGVGMPSSTLFDQVRATMLVTVFVFLGIEGASVYSRYAEQRSHVGIATIFGFLGVTTLMVCVTLLPYAVLARADIAQMRQPSMAAVLEAVVGPWGSVFVRTCSNRLVSGIPSPPQKFARKRSALKAKIKITMKTRIGMIFATVTSVLINAACWTPRRIVKWKSQMPTEATTIAVTVLPSPKTGKNAPRVDLISTQ
jgi:arginine:ornithine antiporter/lysine permease